MRIRFFWIIALLGLTLTNSSCIKKGCTDPAALNYDEKAKRDDRMCEYGDKHAELKRDIMITYADIAYAMYYDAYSAAVMFQLSVNEFAAAPTTAKLTKCRNDWQTVHSYWAQCDAFRYAQGPVDTDNWGYVIGSWPVNPSYIDYTRNQPQSGIVGDTADFIKITEARLNEAMQGASSGNFSLGLHVLEYLLWGEDTTEADELLPGRRPLTDFTTDFFAQRRLTYLKEASSHLVSSLSTLSKAWEDVNKGNYRYRFLNQGVNPTLKQILSGMATLANADIAENQLLPALQVKNEALERCRFSDRTSEAIEQSARGISILYLGEYTTMDGITVEGPSMFDLMIELDPELANDLTVKTKASADACKAIPSPFDYQMSEEQWPGEGPLAKAYVSLTELATMLQDAGTAIGITVVKDLP